MRILPKVKTVFSFIIQGFRTLQLSGLEKTEEEFTQQTSEEEHLLTSVCVCLCVFVKSLTFEGLVSDDCAFHSHMDNRAALGINGRPSSDTTVTVNTNDDTTKKV